LETVEGQETSKKRDNEEKSGIQEWVEENEDEMGNMVDPYYEL